MLMSKMFLCSSDSSEPFFVQIRGVILQILIFERALAGNSERHDSLKTWPWTY